MDSNKNIGWHADNFRDGMAITLSYFHLCWCRKDAAGVLGKKSRACLHSESVIAKYKVQLISLQSLGKKCLRQNNQVVSSVNFFFLKRGLKVPPPFFLFITMESSLPTVFYCPTVPFTRHEEVWTLRAMRFPDPSICLCCFNLKNEKLLKGKYKLLEKRALYWSLFVWTPSPVFY